MLNVIKLSIDKQRVINLIVVTLYVNSPSVIWLSVIMLRVVFQVF
jgi:hypothetical protein